MLNSSGLATPPCGVPCSVGASRPLSITPALSQPATAALAGNVPSWSRIWSCPTRSNAAVRSASSTHRRLVRLPATVQKIAAMASWQLRPGLNPSDLGSNRASHSGSNALTARACNALSAITGTCASYCGSVHALLGLGFDVGWELVGGGDSLQAGGLELGGEADPQATGGAAAGGDVAVFGPVVDDVGFDAESGGDVGDAVLVVGAWGGVEVGVLVG